MCAVGIKTKWVFRNAGACLISVTAILTKKKSAPTSTFFDFFLRLRAARISAPAGTERKKEFSRFFRDRRLVIGTLLLFIPFSQDYSVGRALYIALFTSLAAFNNAGFDLFSTSLLGYNDDPLVLVTVGSLIILGGIGYVLMLEVLIGFRRRRRLSLHSKIVLTTTAGLLVSGTLLFYFLTDLDMKNAFFQATTTRTAGFFSCDQASLPSSALILTIALMFIGASPGSTGGGIKTTTFFVAVKAAFRASL